MDEQMTKKSPFNITIDRQVIKLLGAHLYGDTPSVINELVANSYDARAKRIWISIKTSAPYQIRVQDDGVGMTLSEINEYYLNIGYNRRVQKDLQEELTDSGIFRLDMGQKGIGKLAVFALSKQVRLISVKNNSAIGCFMDFDEICKADGQPMPFDTSNYMISSDFLSPNGSGTVVILENVVKDLSKAYKFIVSSLARSFILNNEDVKIFIRKDDEDFKLIQRANLNYFKYIDVFATIGSDFSDFVKRVKDNPIEDRYKKIFSYDYMVSETETLPSKKKFDRLPLKLSVFNKNKTDQVSFDFKFNGWIGTVQNEDCFKALLENDGYTQTEIADKDLIIVDDNRISIYSRGKVGEYNILPKLKTKAANDAYLIGEIFVDDFEEDSLIDMATSNRRGYQEDDPRYEALCRNLKLLVSRIVSTKQAINKKRKEDSDQAEASQIKIDFVKGHIKSKQTFEKMTEEDKKLIEEDHRQFARAVSLSNQESSEIKKLLISHRQGELKDYGNFIIDTMLKINPSLENRIVFTSNPKYGLPKGKDLFDSLKDCFRPDYFVVFLFTKSFYDSNACLAEAGAAWATNTNYINIVVDIPFAEIDNPINRNIGGARFCFKSEEDINEFAYTIQSILINIDKEYPIEDIKNAINEKLKENGADLRLPPYEPKRRYQVVPLCKKCHRPMELHTDPKGRVYYKCTQPNHGKVNATIK